MPDAVFLMHLSTFTVTIGLLHANERPQVHDATATREHDGRRKQEQSVAVLAFPLS